MPSIEVRAFGKLLSLFNERGWAFPLIYDIDSPLTAAELRDRLSIPAEQVEAVFINRQIKPLSTILEGGERVAFVPPGVPSIHRFNLGFYEARE